MRILVKALLAASVVAGFSGAAMAADLYVPPPAAPVAAPAATNWDGPYIGANVGYSWATADHLYSGGVGNDISLSGFEVGGQIGYNFHVADQLVLGVEGSLNWSNENGTNIDGGLAPAGDISQTINWEGMLTARLGVDVGNILPYVDAGVAFANSTRDASNFGGTSASQTQTGWTVGVGVEAMLADHLSGFVSYNYADYGNATFATGGISPSVHLTDNIVKAGLNWHF